MDTIYAENNELPKEKSYFGFGGETERLASMGNVMVGEIKASSFSSFTLIGNTAYCLKSGGNDDVSVLYKVPDFEIDKRILVKSYPKKTPLGHGNGMCNYNNELYVATMHNEIVRMNLSGKILNTYAVPETVSPVEASNIAHYSQNKFIVSTDKHGPDRLHPKFAIGTFNDSTKKFDILDRFYIENIASCETPQDIYYHTKKDCFFAIFYNMNTHLENAILEYKLKGKYSTYNNCKMYSPTT